MTEQEIIEGNKLIAEFMGHQKYATYGYIIHEDGTYPAVDEHWHEQESFRGSKGKRFTPSTMMLYISHKDLHYDDSWDWLMPVVKKCYRLQYKQGWKKVNCIQHCLTSYDFMSDIAIEIVWEEVIKFINWYNTTN